VQNGTSSIQKVRQSAFENIIDDVNELNIEETVELPLNKGTKTYIHKRRPCEG